MSDYEPTNEYAYDAAHEANRTIAQTQNGIKILSNSDPNSETNAGGIILSKLEKIEKLQAEVIRDSLTGVFNRRYFDGFMENIGNEVVGLAILDIDHFKKVNDTFGHPAGDAFLKGFARQLNDSVREERVDVKMNDIVVRYGGEEFAVIFRGKDLDIDALAKKCEDIKNSLKNTPFWVSESTKVSRTVSIGLGIRIPGETPDIFIKRVDKSTYQAKDNGRNRVAVSR